MPKSPVLLLSSLLIALPLLASIRGEAPVAGPLYGNAPSDQSDAHIAASGDRFLAVWIDAREGTETVYAARFDTSGNLLDPTGIRLPLPHGANHRLNAVLPMDDGWALLWSEQDFVSETPVPSSRIMFARIDRDGHIIDPPRPAVENAYAAVWGSAATNGSRIVVFYDLRSYALLDERANLLRQGIVGPLQASSSEARVTSNGSDFVIEAQQKAITINASGDIVASTDLTALRDVPMGLASDGVSYMTVTRNFDTAQFVAHPFGSGVQSSAVPVPLSSFPGIPTSGELIWDGTEYVLAVVSTVEANGSAYQQSFGVRIDRAGNALDAQPFVLSERAFGFRTMPAAIASSGGKFAAVWNAIASDLSYDVYADIIDRASLQPSSPVLLSRSANLQVNPALAFSGRNFLVEWQETSGTYVGRIGLNGEVLDGRGLRISPAGSNPKVVFDGVNYLVGWITAAPGIAILWIDRVTPDGQVLDGDGIKIAQSTCVFDFDMAPAADRTLIAWDECGYRSLHAVAVDRSAQPVGTPVAITPDAIRTANPTVAWNGSEYLVAFQEQTPIPCPLPTPAPCESFRSNIRAVRLSSELTVLDTDPLAIAVSDSEDQKNPRAASNGIDFLVGWTVSDMRTRPVLAGGTLGDATSLGSGNLSSVIRDGSDYLLAYASNGDTFLTHAGFGERTPISATADTESAPQIVAVADHRVAAAYDRVATEPLYGGVPRVFLREIDTRPRVRSVRTR